MADWGNLPLEASSKGPVAQGKQGFDYERGKSRYGNLDSLDVVAMIAIGIRGPKENLPMTYQKKETPNGRKPLREIVMEGGYTGK